VWLTVLAFWYDYGPPLRKWWQAAYPLTVSLSSGALKIAHVEIDGVRSSECPKSILLNASRADELVQIFIQAEAVGNQPFGSAENWPGSFFDSVKLLKDQRSRDEAAVERAIRQL
jgi:hypothetical protein